MNRGPANRRRMFIYLLVTWLFVWSLFRMLFFPQQLISGSLFESLNGLIVTIATGILAIVWVIGGPLLLNNWHELSIKLVSFAGNSRRAHWVAWTIPAVIWFLAFSLLILSRSLNPSMADGPVIVLAVFGAAMTVLLLGDPGFSEEQDSPQRPEVRQLRGRVHEPFWTSMRISVKHVLSVLLLGLIVLLWFQRALFDASVVVYGRDMFDQYYVLEDLVNEVLQNGQIPLWNPYIFSGSPLLGQSQSLVFYPPQLVLRLLPLNLSISWAIAFHVWIAGAGMFALTRWKGMRIWISLVCAIVYMLNGGLLLRIFAGHIWLVYALSWLPLVWLLIMVALKTGQIIFMIAAAVGTSIIVLTGHPTFPIYILLFFGFYWLFVCYTEWKDSGSWHDIAVISGRFLVIMVLALGLSAIQIVPTFVMNSQVSLAQGYGTGGAGFLALSVSDLMALIIPRLYVSAEKQNHAWELLPYMGVLIVLLLPFSYAAKRNYRFRNFLSMSALASLAIALGGSIGIYYVLYQALPPFRVARIPPRSLVIFIPTVTLLAGMGLQAIAEHTANSKLFSIIIRAYLFLSAFILGVAVGGWLNVRRLAGIHLSENALLLGQLALGGLLIVLVHARLAGGSDKPDRRSMHIVFVITLFIVGFLIGVLVMPSRLLVSRQLTIFSFLVAIFSALLTTIYYHGAKPLAVFALIGLVFIDLFIANRSYIRAEEPPVFYQNERLLLEDVELKPFDRVLSTVDAPMQYMLGRASNIDGYNSGILSGYEQFLRGVTVSRGTTRPRILFVGSSVDPRALDFLGVKYILSEEALDNEVFESVASDDSTYLYENPGILPHAFVVYDAVNARTVGDALKAMRDPTFDYASQVVLLDAKGVVLGRTGESTVDIVHYSEADGSMLMRVATTEPGILVLSEPYYPERRVWVDGSETDILPVNLGFIGAAIPSGTHDVELRYVPRSLYVGGAITAFSVLVCMTALVYTFASSSRRGKKKL